MRRGRSRLGTAHAWCCVVVLWCDRLGAGVCWLGLAGVCAFQAGGLVLLEDVQLVLVDGLPVVVEYSAGVAGVGVPGPVGVADVVLLGVVEQGALPDALGGGGGDGLAAELADQDGGLTVDVEVGPVLLPQVGHVVGVVLG